MFSIWTTRETGLYDGIETESTKETKYMYVRTKNGEQVETFRIKLVLVDHDCSKGISFT